MINQNETNLVTLMQDSNAVTLFKNLETILQSEESEDIVDMFNTLDASGIQELLSFYTQMKQVFGYNIFEGGRTVHYSSCEQLAMVKNDGRVAMTTAENLREFEAKNLEIAREKQKFKKADLTSISGFLPNSKEVFTVAAYGVGRLLDSSLSYPEYEGGQIFVLALRKSNIDVLVKDKTYPNAGMPTTVFILKTKRECKAKDHGEVSADNVVHGVRIDKVFVACTTEEFSIREDTPLYHYPLSNVNRNSHGNVCLGSYTGSDYLFYQDQVDLATFAYDFFCSLRDSHEYATKYKSSNTVSLDKFLTDLKDKEFSNSELISNGETLESWVLKVANYMY